MRVFSAFLTVSCPSLNEMHQRDLFLCFFTIFSVKRRNESYRSLSGAIVQIDVDDKHVQHQKKEKVKGSQCKVDKQIGKMLVVSFSSVGKKIF